MRRNRGWELALTPSPSVLVFVPLSAPPPSSASNGGAAIWAQAWQPCVIEAQLSCNSPRKAAFRKREGRLNLAPGLRSDDVLPAFVAAGCSGAGKLSQAGFTDSQVSGDFRPLFGKGLGRLGNNCADTIRPWFWAQRLGEIRRKLDLPGSKPVLRHLRQL